MSQFNRKADFKPPMYFGKPDPKYKATKCQTWQSCSKMKVRKGDGIVFSRNTKLPFNEKHTYHGIQAKWTSKDTYYVYLGAECQTGPQLYVDSKSGWTQCAKVCEGNPDCQGFYIHGVAVTHFNAVKDFRPPNLYGEHKKDTSNDKCVTFMSCSKMKAHGGDGFVVSRKQKWNWAYTYKLEKGVLTDKAGKVLRKP